MNLREIGVEWHDNNDKGIRLWVHPGSSFGKLNIVVTHLDRLLPRDKRAGETGNHVINNMRDAFMIAEAFILDYEASEKTAFVNYLEMRSAFDTEANMHLFMNTLSYEDVEFLFVAFNSTRPSNGDKDSGLDTPEKKGNSEPDS